MLLFEKTLWKTFLLRIRAVPGQAFRVLFVLAISSEAPIARQAGNDQSISSYRYPCPRRSGPHSTRTEARRHSVRCPILRPLKPISHFGNETKGGRSNLIALPRESSFWQTGRGELLQAATYARFEGLLSFCGNTSWIEVLVGVYYYQVLLHRKGLFRIL